MSVGFCCGKTILPPQSLLTSSCMFFIIYLENVQVRFQPKDTLTIVLRRMQKELHCEL